MTVGKCTSLLFVFLLLATAGLSAQEEGMPPMGPPEQMAEVAWLVGEWDVEMKTRWDPSSEWVDSKGTAVYSTILDGGALRMDFHGSAPEMPMPLKGIAIQTYDRETDQWQMTWTDNMSCRTSIYTGTHKDDKTVLTGPEMWGGQEFLGRITTFNETPSSFDWKMESSMDGGETWFTGGMATYTRKTE